MPEDSRQRRHAVRWKRGDGVPASAPTIVLAHGFGCDQQIWAPVAAILSEHFPVVLFDHMGCGASDVSFFDFARYVHLNAYAEDLVHLMEEMGLERPILVGHSVSGAIGWLASLQRPDLFRQIIAIGPSARYLDDEPDYCGGFSEKDVRDMIDLMERNHFEWAGYLAPMVLPCEGRPQATEQLRQSFLSADPEMSKQFAKTTFYSDIRGLLPNVTVPSLILYSEHDVIVPTEAVRYLQKLIPDCRLGRLQARGHYPHISDPEEVAGAILEGALLEA